MTSNSSDSSIGFMQPRNYAHFKYPPMLPDDTGQLELQASEEEWLECASFLEEDLKWILKLPHHRFWSQVVHDEKLHKCLESYLFQAPRRYDLLNVKLKEEVKLALFKIHKLVFRVFLRMSTFKESKEHNITPKAFGDLLYDNFLFDIPKIMDLCALYRVEDNHLLSKMILNIFSNQPNYFDDLSKASQVVLEAFCNIEEKLSSLQDGKNTSLNTSLSSAKLSSLHDVINYIVDVCYTLHAFLEIYTPACQIFYQNGVNLRISLFYESVFPVIEREMYRRSRQGEDERKLQEIKRKISLSKTLLVEIFRNILNYCCIEGIIQSKSADDNQSTYNAHLNQFFDIFTDIISAKNFLQDYNMVYPIESDFDFFNDLGLKVDLQRVNYILGSIHDKGDVVRPSFMSSGGARPKTKNASSVTPSFQNAVDILKGPQEKPSTKSETNGFSEIEINSLVNSICDCLNLTDRSLVEKCLQHFDYDADRTIDAYCTDNIPDHLKTVNKEVVSNKSKSIWDAEPGAQSNAESSILLERKSVFDNDEFDLFRRNDVNMDKIHLGKKNKVPSAYETLSKDKDSDFLKQYALDWGNSEENEFVDNEALYEDEYDDTYDSSMVGLNEPVPEGQPDVDASSENKKNEQIPGRSENSFRDSSRDFCENPEIIRQRQQQRRESKLAARGGNRRAPPPSDDSQNRQNKDRNKAYTGNHNRRKQSDFKKSRGMFS